MNINDKINILLEAEKAFRQNPDKALSNSYGLCKFFEEKYKLSKEEIFDLLGNKYDNKGYQFAGYRPQTALYDTNAENSEKFARANWCAEKVKELKNNSDLILFLQSENIENEFKNNIIYDMGTTIKKEDIIIEAFKWENTKEGLEFWKNVEKKWKDFIDKDDITSFTEFLKNAGVYDKYINNSKVENQRWTAIKDYYGDLEYIKNAIKSLFWITTAFNWDASEEGYDYWNDINEKWISLLKNNPGIEANWD